MKLSGSEDAVQCGDKEGRNDDHAFWLEAAETGETLAKERARERETIEAMLPLCPPFQQGNEKSICIAAHQFAHFHSASFTGRDELGEYYQQADANTSLFFIKTLI